MYRILNRIIFLINEFLLIIFCLFLCMHYFLIHCFKLTLVIGVVLYISWSIWKCNTFFEVFVVFIYFEIPFFIFIENKDFRIIFIALICILSDLGTYLLLLINLWFSDQLVRFKYDGKILIWIICNFCMILQLHIIYLLIH